MAQCDFSFQNQKIVRKGEKIMPKMKSKKALTKRVKVTGTGKLVRHSAYTGHNSHQKTTKQKKRLSKASVVDHSDYKRIKDLIQ